MISIRNQHGEQELDKTRFPNGESVVNGGQILGILNQYRSDYPNVDTLSITFRFEDDNDLIRLMFVKKFLDSHNIKSELFIPYMPYSRMDRVEGESVFTLKYVAQFINDLGFQKVTVAEPHSDVTLALLDRVTAVYPSIELIPVVMEKIGFDVATDYLVFPDAGAQKRYGKVSGTKQLVGFKEREFATGKIKGTKLVGDVQPGFKAIIVDDLCSKGGTFLGQDERTGDLFGIATELKKAGASEIYLLITHCENTIYDGIIPESDIINRVFATTSIQRESQHEKVFLYDIHKFQK